MNEALQRLQAEKDDLHARSYRLAQYILSPKFSEQTEAMQDVLKRQVLAMDLLESALKDRIALVGGES